MKITILFFLIITLSGCASKMIWYHETKLAQQYYMDTAQCESMSNSAGRPQAMGGTSSFSSGYNMGAAIAAKESRDRIYSNCMMGQGWRRVPEESLPVGVARF